jgi:hypothetical protein
VWYVLDAHKHYKGPASNIRDLPSDYESKSVDEKPAEKGDMA